MMRVTPCRLMTLQCSQIGFTLLRTFTSYSLHDVGKRAGALSIFPRLAFQNTLALGVKQVTRSSQTVRAPTVSCGVAAASGSLLIAGTHKTKAGSSELCSYGSELFRRRTDLRSSLMESSGGPRSKAPSFSNASIKALSFSLQADSPLLQFSGFQPTRPDPNAEAS